ncbi:unnamed protein product [Ambrosiozyma monospora]|uniref:Unnamed protein product n=1 Tax=Ambrosiozyma monospora TaxID=43982 RepID=A0ACB5TR53_AMBMO|nr:unnamed protein product [Ambrosiozyma monospora]
MVQFGPNPSEGSVFHASRFAVHELPIRLSHRVKELEELPYGLNDDPAIKLVRDWYAMSFEELTELQDPEVHDDHIKKLLLIDQSAEEFKKSQPLVDANVKTTTDPRDDYNHCIPIHDYASASSTFEDDGLVIHRNQNQPTKTKTTNTTQLNNHNNSTKIHDLDPYHTHVNPLSNSTNPLKSYYHYTPKSTLYPPAIINYNNKVTQTLTKIKRRHDATVTTLARGVQNWKLNYRDQLHSHSTSSLSSFPLNQFLDRFYMSRIGIRMLIGQTIALNVQHKGNITNPDYVGVIALRANVMEIAQDAISAARFACEEHYGIMDAPEVELYCPKDLQFISQVSKSSLPRVKKISLLK